jgi:sugar lactone lactonase YvrE
MPAIGHEETIAFALVPGTPARLGESPVWDVHSSSLWWVDIDGRRLSKTGAATGRTTSWETPEMPCFVVITSSGDPAVGMESGIFAFYERNARFERIVELHEPLARFNDATVDVSDRLWAGTMHRSAGGGAGALYSVSGDRHLVIHLDGLNWPNGLACDGARIRGAARQICGAYEGPRA